MGFLDVFRWIWNLFFGRRGRLGEEKEEEMDEKKTVKLTKKQEGVESEENDIIKELIGELEKIEKIEGGVKIKVGDTQIGIIEPLDLLINHLKILINTGESNKEEKKDENKIRTYWGSIRRGLINHLEVNRVELHKIADKIRNIIKNIDSLFKKWEMDIRIEDELTEEKLRLIREEYQLVHKERG